MNNQQTTFSAVLGLVLSTARQEKSIEQNQMAQLVGLSQASYSRLESGKSAFTVDQMFHCAQALSISGEELTQRLHNTIRELNLAGISVLPQLRANSSQGKALDEQSKIGHVLAGAALGALLIGLISKKSK